MSGTANKAPKRERVLTTEEAALRNVAMLVARGVPTPEIFDAVAEQVARMFGRPWVGVMQYDSAESFVVLATWGEHPLPVGSRWPLDGPSPYEAVLRTGRPVGFVDYAGLPGTVAEAARSAGIVGAIAAPIVVDEVTWGVIAVPATATAPIPEGAETRLSVFTELVATAISNADARASVALLADEQAALRRVATLVARESSPAEIFRAVTEEARRVLASEAVGLLRFDPDETATLLAQSDTPWEPPPLGTRFTLDGENVVAQVFRTGQTVRVDDWTESTGAVAAMATVLGVRSAVASPVLVEGRLWGTVIAATSRDEPLRATTESRLVQFTALVATAIANAGARSQLSRLAGEQAALRRVAVLVAQEPSPEEVFAAVTEAVGPLLDADLSAMHVFRDDGVAMVVASWSQAGPTLPIGTELPLDGDSAVARIFRTRAAARIDGYTDVEGDTAEVARGLRLRTAVGAPILVEGKLWGALMAATRGEEPLPDDVEMRIAAFTELVATAVSNAQARDDLQRLADEQAALRRVATLVAEDAPPAELFGAVTLEVGTLLGADFSGMARLADDAVNPLAGWAADGEHPPLPERWPMQPGDPVTAIVEARHAVRWDTWTGIAGPIAAFIREELGVRSTVGTPIVVEGRMWGVLAVHSRTPLPQDSESRMEQFSNLVATAVSNAEARAEVARLADEQAALRRIATLVARGVDPERVFAAVAAETDAAYGATSAVVRFEHDPPSVVVTAVSRDADIPVGTHLPLTEGMAAAEIYRTGRPGRSGRPSLTGEAAETADQLGTVSQVGVPVVVEGRPWGALMLLGRVELPPSTERRLERFTDLVTTALANAEARVALRAAADEQGALSRVATLVAASAVPSEVFAAVTSEIAVVLGADATLLCRADPDGAAVVVGTWGDNTPLLGTRIPRGGTNLITIVLDTAHPARVESYENATGDASEVARSHGLRSAVGAPILVEGRLWGLVIAGTTGEHALASDAEERLAGFTKLVATAISNAQAQEDLRSLAEQQAALRRVATLVARRVAPQVVFERVAAEAGRLLHADITALVRYETSDTATVIVGPPFGPFATGDRVSMDPAFVVDTVRATGRPARFETDDPLGENMPDVVRRFLLRSAIASPILVGGGLWGAIALGSRGASFPPETEHRLDEFTELAATAISNATARTELIASRARIVAAGDEARRRIERNLHDGTQQRLIALGLDLQRARAEIPDDQSELHSTLVGVEEDLEAILVDLRELSHGLHPQLLSRLGLGPSLQALARRSPIPVHLDVDLAERPAAPLETAVYYVVSEALTNAIKHSHASEISVTITSGDKLEATIVDDGVGDADPRSGSGLTGLLDRIDVLGGRFTLDSPPRGGTRISIELPVEPTVAP